MASGLEPPTECDEGDRDVPPAARNRSALRTTSPSGSLQASPNPDRHNWLLHVLYVREERAQCEGLIVERLRESGLSAFALLVQALLLRAEGHAAGSLDALRAGLELSPRSPELAKQFARSLLLLGRHSAAQEAYRAASTLCQGDWEVHHYQGVCCAQRGDIEQAKVHLAAALRCGARAATYDALGRLYIVAKDTEGALQVYRRAVTSHPEDAEMLTTLGLLYLQAGSYRRAFENLGNALVFDPSNHRTVLAAGSLMQKHGDHVVALSKYRAAAHTAPESAPMWNNIGMAFTGQGKFLAAVSCLKRAHYLSPFDPQPLYNLALVHLSLRQPASAYNFAWAARSLRPQHAATYGLLAIALAQLDDAGNACRAYERAMKLDAGNPTFALNLAMLLHRNGDRTAAITAHQEAERRAGAFREAGGELDPELADVAHKLVTALHLRSVFVWSSSESKSSKDKHQAASRSQPPMTLGTNPILGQAMSSAAAHSLKIHGDGSSARLPQHK